MKDSELNILLSELRAMPTETEWLKFKESNDQDLGQYMHASLKYVSGEYRTNQTLRQRFEIEEKNYSIESRIISLTINENLIKYLDSESNSKKHAKYIPFWV